MQNLKAKVWCDASSDKFRRLGTEIAALREEKIRISSETMERLVELEAAVERLQVVVRNS